MYVPVRYILININVSRQENLSGGFFFLDKSAILIQVYYFAMRRNNYYGNKEK